MGFSGLKRPLTCLSSRGKAVRPIRSPTIRLFTNWCSPVQEQSQKRPLILVAGYIHDVSTFIEEHPGGRHLLVKNIGKDASTAFFGGVYDHSNAAHNVRLHVFIDCALCLLNLD